MNPFSFDKISQPSEFCGRDEELLKLIDFMSNKVNVLLYGDRRYGKSSLIHKAFNDLPNSVLTIYVDLYSIVDEMDFVRELHVAVEKSIPKSLRSETSKILNLLSSVKGVDFKPSISGESFTFKPSFSSKNFDELLDSAIELIEQYCKHSNCTHAVIAFDEFQQIAEITSVKIDAKLRAISQTNANVSFVFSGSQKTILRTLLNDPAKPWHGMTTPMTIKGIDEKQLKLYCEQRLTGQFKPKAFELLYNTSRGQTRLILQACYQLYGEDIRCPDVADSERILCSLISAFDDEFRDRYIGHTARQKKALKSIAHVGESGVFTQSSLDNVNMTKQAMSQAIKVLEKTDTVTKVDAGRYYINNVLFSLWLKRTI